MGLHRLLTNRTGSSLPPLIPGRKLLILARHGRGPISQSARACFRHLTGRARSHRRQHEEDKRPAPAPAFRHRSTHLRPGPGPQGAGQQLRSFISSAILGQKESRTSGKLTTFAIVPALLFSAGLLIYSIYPADELRRTRDHQARRPSNTWNEKRSTTAPGDDGDSLPPAEEPETAWFSFSKKFSDLSAITDIEWSALSDRVVDAILPEWSKILPGHIRKLQRELSMAPGSLADEIWHEAHDPFINPEIRYSATVRVSDELCDEEREFLARRKKVTTAALAHYLGIPEDEIHPDDTPTIAMCGSGGGLRALVAGTGSMLATHEDGLFDCITYTSGVSGSCWLQTLYHSSIAGRRLDRIIDHMKSRLDVHIAYPPVAFSSVLSAPTNKLLLSSVVEKLKGDPNADFSLVDVYGILLAARLLVPKGELGTNDRDFKMSNQKEYIKYGQHPMPIYTAVRHEIPDLSGVLAKSEPGVPSEEEKNIAKQESWFQWFEMTPYEVFCEEFNAGIPTWALGRKFNGGVDVPPQTGFHLPELRMPLLMGLFGSAFCATLSHYYAEIRPLVKHLAGFSAVDDLVHGRSQDLDKVHPFDPAQIPNFVYGMRDDQLRFTTPTAVHRNEYIQLMDAGMSNNLPIYPLLRPGRDVDIIVAFDASADIKTDNWLSVADGYARQRNIKGWPIGVGWPKPGEPPQQTAQELDKTMHAGSDAEAQAKLEKAQNDQAKSHPATKKNETPSPQEDKASHDQAHPEDSDLGYCTIWVGHIAERSSSPPPPSKAVPIRPTSNPDQDPHAWQPLHAPDAGIAVVYLPFLANLSRAPGVDPAHSDFMSTWNFVYTAEQIDKVVQLARANYDEGKEQIRGCVRAVYERKKRIREEREERRREEKRRHLRRLGIEGRLGEGDHFS